MEDGGGNRGNRGDTGGSVMTRSTGGRRRLAQALDDPEALLSKRGRRGHSRGRSRGRGRSGGRRGRTVAESSAANEDPPPDSTDHTDTDVKKDEGPAQKSEENVEEKTDSSDSDVEIPLARTKKKPPPDTDTDVEKDEDSAQESEEDTEEKNDSSSDSSSDTESDGPAEEEDTDAKDKDDSAEETDAKDKDDPVEETDAKDKDDPAEETDIKDKDDPAEETDAKDKDDPADSTKRTIIIEHWPKAPIFRNRAKELQASIEQSDENINVLINPDKKPKKPSFLVRSESGAELYLSLVNLKKPYKELTDFDVEDVVAKIVAK
ncbi:uncharacterized protein LOC130797797 [Amaranthus tricolor]|uniref:uncharacterized protein LOC130797797 n=1 Tax=Amaranthus tricolor TaxID=29722 RepID=UPI00259026AA|nr:uncharacterized protein LOC130797797 [Amaranthus tricolor]